MMIDFNYLWSKYAIKPTGVLHIGANTGQEAEFYYNSDVKEVIWVEGHIPTYEKLVENVGSIPGTKCIQACVSDRYSETYFHVANNESQSSSLLELGHHKNIHPEVHYVDSVPVKTFRVDDLLKDYNFSGEWFLNIDIQGAELFAIKGMGNLLKHFKWVYSEVNKLEVYIGCPTIYDIDAYLSDFGFERKETGDWVAGSWTDALYIKRQLLTSEDLDML